MKAQEAARRLRSFLPREMTRARRLLESARDGNAEKPIHETRKAIKKLRAALRLTDDNVNVKAQKAVAAALREAAHLLGPLRDTLVLAATAKRLGRAGESPLPVPPTPKASESLRAARVHLRHAERGLRPALEITSDPGNLAKALRRLYRCARTAMKQAEKKLRDDTLHRWRRRTKDLLYNLELFAAPAGYVKKLKRLTDYLGDDHDLAFFAGHHASRADGKVHRPLFRRLQKKRRHLQDKAFALGGQIFRHKPAKLAGRLLG